MATVQFTRHLCRFFPDLADVQNIDADDVAGVVSALEHRFPGLAAYLVDDAGSLRTHVNIFVDGEMVHDRIRLSDRVASHTELHVIQALSGG